MEPNQSQKKTSDNYAPLMIYQALLKVILCELPHFRLKKSPKSGIIIIFILLIGTQMSKVTYLRLLVLSWINHSLFLLCLHITLCIFYCIIITATLTFDRKNSCGGVSLPGKVSRYFRACKHTEVRLLQEHNQKKWG